MYFGPPIKNLLETHLKQAYMEQTNFQKEEQNQQNITFKWFSLPPPYGRSKGLDTGLNVVVQFFLP